MKVREIAPLDNDDFHRNVFMREWWYWYAVWYVKRQAG